MCSSAPRVKPIASAPIVSPTSIDDAAVEERDRERRRGRARTGRTSTILAGGDAAGMPPTGGVKTALGS